ncbi:MAG: hypothetical protein OXF02_05655 [Simkaniaceae bacterium]|nr:hypothetical protein [Simkaniaceae bacterium]
MASAIGEGWNVVWPASAEKETATRKRRYTRQKGTAIWFHKVPGGPPLRFGPLPEGARRRGVTAEERRAVVDYALEVRMTKSMNTCAKEVGIGPVPLSNWIKWGCAAYQIFSCLNVDDRTLRTIDYRKLLTALRSGIRSVIISDYTEGKYSTRKSRLGTEVESVLAQEEVRGGHPYFLSPGKGQRRVFTGQQRTRVLDYWFEEFDGESLSECARRCNLYKNTLIKWVNEHEPKQASPDTAGLPEISPGATACDSVEAPLPDISRREVASFSGFPGGRVSPNSECESSLSDAEKLWPANAEEGVSTRLAERMDGPPPLKRRREKGTATWLDKRFGGPPLRFDPLPKGKRKYTEEERGAVVDYAVEQREMKTVGECAQEIGVGSSCISCWMRKACKAYRAFRELDLDTHTLRMIDYRKLLPDLRAGKPSLCVEDYTEGEKYSKGKRGQKLKDVQAREETRNGRLYFTSPEKGERRVFSEEQKERAVDYWFNEFDGDVISNCAKTINLSVCTLTGWVDAYGRGRRRCLLHTTESSGSPHETTTFDPDEAIYRWRI